MITKYEANMDCASSSDCTIIARLGFSNLTVVETDRSNTALTGVFCNHTDYEFYHQKFCGTHQFSTVWLKLSAVSVPSLGNCAERTREMSILSDITDGRAIKVCT